MPINSKSRGTQSIYEFTKGKLEYHGVTRTKEGMLILRCPELFLGFIRLERACAASSFDCVVKEVKAIQAHLSTHGIEHAVVYAYLYVGFNFCYNTHTKPCLDEDGYTVTVTYSNFVSDEEILIRNWAFLQKRKFADHFWRAMHWIDE